MVELLRRYTGDSDLKAGVARFVARAWGDGIKLRDPDAPFAAFRAFDASALGRLSAQDRKDLVKRFSEGMPKVVLAADYGISVSSVKRILRADRAARS